MRRSQLSRERATLAERHHANCYLCAHHCGADRTRGPAGRCHSDSTARIFQHRVDWGGESELTPTFVVNFSGCNMNCAFCITGTQSQNGSVGTLRADAVLTELRAVAPQLRSFTVEGGEPSIHLSAALQLISEVPDTIPVIWKTNGYASERAMRLLTGIPAVVLADYKFGNDECALRLARIPHYCEVLSANLLWAHQTSKLIVRHLLMPGHLTCCFIPVANWLAENMPDVQLSLMTGFLPKFKSCYHADINRTNTSNEVTAAISYAKKRGLCLADWHLAPPPQTNCSEASLSDEIWIDRNGRICVGFATGALADCLKQLAPELRLRT